MKEQCLSCSWRLRLHEERECFVGVAELEHVFGVPRFFDF